MSIRANISEQKFIIATVDIVAFYVFDGDGTLFEIEVERFVDAP
jgi:hypothetical protein